MAARSSITQPEPRLIDTMVSSNATWSTCAGMPVPRGYSLTISWSGTDGISPSRTSAAASSLAHDGRSPMR